MKTLKLFAGVPMEVGETGRFFRIFSAQAEVNVTFSSAYENAEWELGTPLASGIGLNFSNRPSPFTRFTIVSDVDQTIEYWASIDSADDDRVSGASSITVISVGTASNTPAKQTLNDTVNTTEVLAYSATRKSALLQLSGDCYVDSIANGVIVSGSIVWENRAALNLIPVSAGVEVRILEETA